MNTPYDAHSDSFAPEIKARFYPWWEYEFSPRAIALYIHHRAPGVWLTEQLATNIARICGWKEEK